MNIIYENTIKAMGECAQEFREENMFVLFGDSAPEEIKDFCYWVDVAPIHGTIALAGLGHCSFKFSGQTEVELLGTIYVEDKPMPDIQVGTVLQIVEE